MRKHKVTAWYYIGEICRYLLNQPERADDAEHTLRRMSGAGAQGRSLARVRAPLRHRAHLRGLSSTEANYGLTNVDGKVGSVGACRTRSAAISAWCAMTWMRTHTLRPPAGALVLCRPGEVGELIAEVLDGPTAAGFFEGYTSAEATEAKVLRNVFRPGDRWMRSGDLVRFDTDDYFYFVDRSGIPSAGRVRTSRPTRLLRHWRASPVLPW